MKKKNFVIILLLLILSTTTVFSQSLENLIPQPSEANYNVYDEFNILSENDIKYINNTNNDLNKKTKGQIVVAVVHSLDGYTIEEYATEMFKQWQIGDKQEKNGVLLLLSIGDGKLKIETGYGTEGFIPDVIASRIIRNIVSYFPEGDKSGSDKEKYKEGILEGYNEILYYFTQEYNIEISDQIAPKETFEEQDLSIGDIIAIIIILLIIFNILNRRPPRGRRRYYYGGFGGGPFSGPYSGGSFGGGSSRGGGGFSGGGGSSGGGGASGSW